MQLIAMMTMLIDHIGYIFFPDEVIWRIIGRIAFPLYAFGIIMGYRHTSNLRKYMYRLFTLAIIAQIPFMLAFAQIKLNVIFTLLFSLIVVILLDKFNNIMVRTVVLILSMSAIEFIPMDYGAYGLLLVLLFRYTQSYWIILGHFSLNLFYFLYVGWEIQLYSVLSTIMIVMVPQFIHLGRNVTPIWLWRSFYPAHLAILALLLYFTHIM